MCPSLNSVLRFLPDNYIYDKSLLIVFNHLRFLSFFFPVPPSPSLSCLCILLLFAIHVHTTSTYFPALYWLCSTRTARKYRPIKTIASANNERYFYKCPRANQAGSTIGRDRTLGSCIVRCTFDPGCMMELCDSREHLV